MRRPSGGPFLPHLAGILHDEEDDRSRPKDLPEQLAKHGDGKRLDVCCRLMQILLDCSRNFVELVGFGSVSGNKFVKAGSGNEGEYGIQAFSHDIPRGELGRGTKHSLKD